MSNVMVTQGTEVPIATDTVGTVRYQWVKIDTGATGTTNPFNGTVGISGTPPVSIANGTVNIDPSPLGNSWGTTITSGTNTLGTLKAGVGGSSIYITDLIISVGTPSNVVLYSGGTASPIVGTLSFTQNGGLVSNFKTPLVAAQGSAVLYQQSANNTLSITATGIVK